MKRTRYRIGAIATSAVLLSAVAVPAMADDHLEVSNGTAQDIVAIDDIETPGEVIAIDPDADDAPVDQESTDEESTDEESTEVAPEAGPAEEPSTDDASVIVEETPADVVVPVEPVVTEPVAGAAPLAVTTVHSTDKSAAGWTMTDRTFGHHEYVTNGLHVWTEAGTGNPGLTQSKAAGYVPADFPLTDAATTTIEFASFSGVRPSAQLVVDRDADGAADGILVYEPWAYADGMWWTSAAGFGVTPGMGYASYGSIDAYSAANPGARVMAVGYSLGSGVIGDAIIEQIVVGGATYTFGLAPVVVTPPVVTTVHSTDKNAAGWGMQNRTFGHHEYVENGLHVWTETGTDNPGLTQSKAAGYVAASFPLTDAATTSIEFSSYSGVRPSVQLAVDRDGNGTWDGYLVYEPWAYGEGNWWTSKTGFGVPAGAGYESLGTIAAFSAANPNAKVIGVGYSLGSGVIGDAVIEQIVVGGATYTFGLEPTVVTPPVPATPVPGAPVAPAVPAAPVAAAPVEPVSTVVPTATEGTLAATGSQAGLLALLGAMVVAAGVGLRRFARR
ncbi:hypothetical protein [Cellulomonas humilata]|uniref:Gram-positive cocci surface proteins LPxTG domain-containing protein n=1 Tax=Cellulomonas humilata TaxID=144055 RepID=A0ABU0EI37_9CELL|nr:hypothetical protein [Cellulomonas humilata]MDQ0374943.1 hypothetical protein [Cellulomonas humilata]